MTLRSMPSPASYAAPNREDTALRAFVDPDARPTTTFPLVLVAVTVAAVSMSVDAVPQYSHKAFFAGIALAVALAVTAAKILDLFEGARWRMVASLLLPTAFGAVIGVVVQALVLSEVGTTWGRAVRDLGGLVDTMHPVPWIASGIVLGGFPALAVSVFLVLASRALRRIVGHDAPERFGVAFTGGVGMLSAVSLLAVDGIAVAPLLVVTSSAALALLVMLLVDGARVRFLRRVYAGEAAAFDIVPVERFAHDPAIAPLVADTRAEAVLVRVERLGSYRAAAAEPIALVAESEHETLSPLLRRRATATCMLIAMCLLAAAVVMAH